MRRPGQASPWQRRARRPPLSAAANDSLEEPVLTVTEPANTSASGLGCMVSQAGLSFLGARSVQAAGGGSAGGGACTPTTAQRVARDSLEAPVLMAINKERRDGGLEPAPRVTVPLLAAFLEGRALGGARWRRGAKKRDELLDDARCAPARAAPRAAPGVLPALPRAPCCRRSVKGHAA